MENSLQLSESQSRILSCLKDLKAEIINNPENVKALNPFLTKYRLNGNISTTLFEMGVISKKRPYRWISSEPTIAMAAEIEEQAALYSKINAQKEIFKNLYNDENPFPYQFKKIWPLLGYNQSSDAKSSLLRSLEEGKDYEIRNIPDKPINFDGFDDDTDILYLSRIGFQMFLATAQKPMAKYFARTIFEIHDEMAKILKQANAGVTHVSEKSNLLDSMEEAIRYLLKFQKNLADEVHRVNCDPAQLLIEFEPQELQNSVFAAFSEATKIATRIYNSTEKAKLNGRLQLSQSC